MVEAATGDEAVSPKASPLTVATVSFGVVAVTDCLLIQPFLHIGREVPMRLEARRFTVRLTREALLIIQDHLDSNADDLRHDEALRKLTVRIHRLTGEELPPLLQAKRKNVVSIKRRWVLGGRPAGFSARRFSFGG